MNILSLTVIALGSSIAVGWILHYLPLHMKILQISFSPRLIACKLVAPFDTVITMLLICGAWVGFTTVTGIGFMVYNVMTGIGLSLGAVFVRKVLAPKWERDYKELKARVNL